MNGLVRDVARSVAFLSRLPVSDQFFADEPSTIASSARAYGFAGVVITLPAALLLLILLSVGVDPLFASALALLCQLLVTGGLHEDGLADCADGFGGGSDRARILTIMKDSTIGAYGGIALVMSLLLRVTGVAVVATNAAPVATALCLLGIGVISRTALIWHWSTLPAAKSDGVAASAGQPDDAATRFAIVSGILISLALVLPAGGPGGAASALVLVALAGLAFARLTNSRIQGHTGDTIGGSQQICEIAALLGLALWL